MFVRVALLVLAGLAVADARPPKPKPPAPAGYLAIESDLPAVVSVDDKKIGETPIVRFELPAGRHVVRAVRDNGDAQRMLVDIHAGMTMAFHLSWDGRDHSDAFHHGFLSVSSTPPAAIWVDGVDTGKTTPVKAIPLKPGRHKVMFVVGGDRFTYPVTIQAGQSVTMMKSF